MPHTSLTATAMGEVRPAIRSAVCYFFLNGFLFGVWASRIPTIRDKLSLGEQQLGLLLLCMGVGAVMAMALSGRWCDTFGQYFVAKRAAWLMAANIPLLALLANLGMVLIIWYGGRQVIDGQLTIGELIQVASDTGVVRREFQLLRGSLAPVA